MNWNLNSDYLTHVGTPRNPTFSLKLLKEIPYSDRPLRGRDAFLIVCSLINTSEANACRDPFSICRLFYSLPCNQAIRSGGKHRLTQRVVRFFTWLSSFISQIAASHFESRSKTGCFFVHFTKMMVHRTKLGYKRFEVKPLLKEVGGLWR